MTQEIVIKPTFFVIGKYIIAESDISHLEQKDSWFALHLKSRTCSTGPLPIPLSFEEGSELIRWLSPHDLNNYDL